MLDALYLTMICFTIFLWLAIGSAGFIFWWTKDWDLKFEDLLFSVVVGVIGPFSFFCGWIIHGDKSILSKILLHRRKIR